MPPRLLAALPPLLVLAPLAAAAEGAGGIVVKDPYADFPPIRLERSAEPPAAAPAPPAVLPRPTRPLDPIEALGLAIEQLLLEELGEALDDGRGRHLHFDRTDRGWRDDDDRDGDEDDD